jgi:ceramide glucosyltransferase
MTLLLGAVAFMSLAISAYAHFCLARKLRQVPAKVTNLPAISVLKPLRGLDTGLLENLLAICQSDYPDFEVIFCATDPDDPALEVARRVQSLCPERPIRVLVGDLGKGLNPKIRLLQRMLPHARHDWVLVSDSNVRPDPDYLRALVGTQAGTGAALVHSLLQGVAGHGLGALLQNLQMNGWVASSIALADAGMHPGVVGKSMLIERRALADVGGLDGVQDLLAEDYVLGMRFAERGHRVALSPHLVPVVGGALDMRGFLDRQLRWAQIRRRSTGALFLGELFVQPLPFFVALAWCGQPEHWVIAALGMTLKWSLDSVRYLRLDRDGRALSLLLLPLKDALSPFIWLVAAFRTRVSWRGHPLRVGRGSQLARASHGPFDILFDRA